ncbi:MAG: HAD hydrolase-like protein, partial [Lachnospiraceae bacterium]|nr:HAD hydrolase-like protein [Lachnospiraceae bacterium]
MYRYILFDLDGTLSDPKVGICTSFQYALSKLGIDEPDIDKLEPVIGPPLKESFANMYNLGEEEIQQGITYYRERYSDVGKFENEIYPGIPELLRDLKKKDRVVAVSSSKPTVYVEEILEHFGIREYFDYVVGALLDGTRDKKEDIINETIR